jgi:DNA adenine methylase
VFRYVGGKNKLAKWVISHFPEHKTYVEPCGGAGWVLYSKPPSEVEVYNDIDPRLVNAWSVMRSPSLRPRLIRILRWMPNSRLYFKHLEYSGDPVWDAAVFLFFQCTSFAGKGKEAGFAIQKNGRNMIMACLDRLCRLGSRFNELTVHCEDYWDVIRRYDGPDTLFYFDPPYVGTESYYNNGSSKFDHNVFYSRICNTRGRVVISYEDCDLVNSLYGREYRREYKNLTRQTDNVSGKARKVAREVLLIR